MKTKIFNSRKQLKLMLVACFILFIQSNALLALGSYSEGWAVVKLTRMEESGIIFSSYEGTFEIANFDSSEECNDKEYLCYTNKPIEMSFSARPENTKLINFLKDNDGKEILVKYRSHRIEAAALSSEFEFLEAKSLSGGMPEGIEKTFSIEKSGSKRSFTIQGRVLRLAYRGTMIGTWEGTYLDTKRNKIHHFSVTDEKMAEYITKTMQSRKNYFFGVSQAYTAPTRDSDYDIFAVDYDKPPR